MGKAIKHSLGLVCCLLFLAAGGAMEMGRSAENPDHRVEGNTYINETHQCRVSVPPGNWKLGL